jgi:hypothetical protein
MMETLALKDTLAGEDLKGALKEDKIEGNFTSKIESHYVSTIERVLITIQTPRAVERIFLVPMSVSSNSFKSLSN